MTCGKQVAQGKENLDGKLPINITLREKERLMTLKEEFWREKGRKKAERKNPCVRSRSLRPRKKVF